MPATAGRVRMPANNRVHSSAALQTHGIWQSAIGYDPYAPTKGKEETRTTSQQNVPSSEPDAENPYASFQGLLALARITGSNADEARGACKRCGRVGHLSFQCRNFLSVKDDKEKDSEAMQADIVSELSKLRGKMGKGIETDSDEEDEDSEDSDSDYNSEIERLIAQKSGKKSVQKERSKKKESDDDESDTDSGERKKRGRSKKRRSSKRKHDDSDDYEEDRKKRRKEKRRKRDESSDEDEKRRRRHRKSRKEKRRRRSHRYSDDSESDASDSDASGSDDARVGRGRKRSYKKSGKQHRVEE